MKNYLAPLTLALAEGVDISGLAADDRLMASVLNQTHRWDNPVARITIARSQ